MCPRFPSVDRCFKTWIGKWVLFGVFRKCSALKTKNYYFWPWTGFSCVLKILVSSWKYFAWSRHNFFLSLRFCTIFLYNLYLLFFYIYIFLLPSQISSVTIIYNFFCLVENNTNFCQIKLKYNFLRIFITLNLTEFFGEC